MRKVEERMIYAIRNKRNYKGRNTEVKIDRFGSTIKMRVYLHGNCIATIAENYIEFDDCGYKTKTTYSRINAIADTFLNRAFSYARNAPHANGVYDAHIWANMATATTVTSTAPARRTTPTQRSGDFIAGFA